MITHLTINNYALITKLDIDLHEGFSVITGETGAGKSIILGAIGLLLGQRADSHAVREGAQRCTIEATYNLSSYKQFDSFFEENDIDYDAADGECILRRELTSAGKSRAFINDTPVSLTVMRQLGSQLIDIHSQHQNLLLQQEDFQLSTIDILSDKAPALLAQYREAYNSLSSMRHDLSRREQQLSQLRQQQDYLQFQFDELSAANLSSPDEQEELEQRSLALSHAEDIKSHCSAASDLLTGSTHAATEALREASRQLSAVADVYKEAASLAERLESSYIEVKDIASDVERMASDTEVSPEELERVDQRIDQLNSLELKYHCADLQELISLRNSLQQQLAEVEDADDNLDQLRRQITKTEEQCQQLAAKLHKERQTTAAKKLLPEITGLLQSLGLPHARFDVQFDQTALSATGTDGITYLFSANPGTPLRALSEIASGGEIARVMLSLKSIISSAVSLPTIIFDEIDTGVSGAIAERMASIMQQMGNNGRQVISITHLPQIAARGSHHYHVAKHQTTSETITTMTLLSADERVQEIAQMLSGADITDAALDNARQLLATKD